MTIQLFNIAHNTRHINSETLRVEAVIRRARDAGIRCTCGQAYDLIRACVRNERQGTP